mgnify:CR=1 FL=1
MKLYVKQKALTLGDTFSVIDETGADLYTVKGSALRKLKLTDTDKKEIAVLKRNSFSVAPCYVLKRNGQKVAKIKMRVTGNKYSVKGLGWTVKSDLLLRTFTLKDGLKEIAEAGKKALSIGDSYEFEIKEGIDTVNALMVLIAVDACLEISTGKK